MNLQKLFNSNFSKCGQVLLAHIIILTGCSNYGTHHHAYSPELNISAFSLGDCLNIQSLSEHLVKRNFNFPSRTTTLDFSIADNLAANTKYSRAYISNFGETKKMMSSLPYVRVAEQTGCTEVVLLSTYNRKLHYTITESGKNYLQLIARPDKDEPGSGHARTEAIENEPKLKKFRVELSSPTSILISIAGDLVMSLCGKYSVVPYQKKTIVRWGNDSNIWPVTENIEPIYLEKVRELEHDLTQPQCTD